MITQTSFTGPDRQADRQPAPQQPAPQQLTAQQPTVLPVQDRQRIVGAYVVGGDGVTYRPAVDVTRLATLGFGAVAVVAVAVTATAALGGRRPAVGPITMGPGGWVSLRGLPAPALRPAAKRPWWARALRARRLVVQP
jgi:hypothetical protein